MGLTTTFHCPVDGCDYETMFRLGMGEETSADAHQDRLDVLRAEHPDHPQPDAPKS